MLQQGVLGHMLHYLSLQGLRTCTGSSRAPGVLRARGGGRARAPWHSCSGRGRSSTTTVGVAGSGGTSLS